jgi:hypothetical protein
VLQWLWKSPANFKEHHYSASVSEHARALLNTAPIPQVAVRQPSS